ncbi:helix-turn-helix domain-containing protein [Falsirhodobacter deserti]|uniref:helix-turn-helix domain-containing protein n=1 Tax=Falsirhodobacter deserti TaxID=1365611 RepID=UPI000FE42BA4|nr:helix-turn-helix domain-containing protein [Falsirhodobacter deserti]
MDEGAKRWYKSNMEQIPTFDLYGEHQAFPDILHCETILDRAAGHDWQIGVHRHADLHQFFLLVAGRAQMTVDGAVQALALPALVSIPRRAAHGFRFARGTEGFVITLPVAEFAELFGASALGDRLAQTGAVPASDDLVQIVQGLADEHRSRRFGRIAALRGLATQLGVNVARQLEGEDTRDHPYARRMAAFDALVHAHLRDRWAVADYARALGMTPTHLSRVARAETGLNASQYIDRQVFQEARRLLAYTRAGVGEVGQMLGFDDPAYFSRAFRRQCKETPQAYRDRLRVL